MFSHVDVVDGDLVGCVDEGALLAGLGSAFLVLQRVFHTAQLFVSYDGVSDGGVLLDCHHYSRVANEHLDVCFRIFQYFSEVVEFIEVMDWKCNSVHFTSLNRCV